MISIYITPDGTQVVQAKLRKDRKISVTHAFEMESFWHGLPLAEGQTADMAVLRRLFRELRSRIKTSYEDIHIVLPDMAFALADCFDAANVDDAKRQALDSLDRLGISRDNLYFSFPMSSRQVAPGMETVFAIRREVVDSILEAARVEKLTLASLEPASISFCRCFSAWTLDYFFVELFRGGATVVSFSPIGGIFKMDAPGLSEEQLLSDKDSEFVQSCSLISEIYARNDYAASMVFKSLRSDASYIVLTGNRAINSIPAIQARLPEKRPGFPPFVVSGIMGDDQLEWMACLGTLMQVYTREDAIFDQIPSFLDIRSSNMLPEHAQQAAKSKQWQAIVRKASMIASATCLAILAMEAAGIVYFGNVKIPDSLQQEYTTAEKTKESVNVEIEVIRAAREKQDAKPFEAYSKLVAARPEGCGFTSVKISQPPKTQDAKDRWIEVNAASSNEMVFQDFQASLTSSGNFGKVTVQTIAADSGNVKTSLITVGKGE